MGIETIVLLVLGAVLGAALGFWLVVGAWHWVRVGWRWARRDHKRRRGR